MPAVLVRAQGLIAGRADQDRSGHEVERLAASTIPEDACSHVRQGEVVVAVPAVGQGQARHLCRWTNGLASGPTLHRRSITDTHVRGITGVLIIPESMTPKAAPCETGAAGAIQLGTRRYACWQRVPVGLARRTSPDASWSIRRPLCRN